MITQNQIKKWNIICELVILIIAMIMMLSPSFRSILHVDRELLVQGVTIFCGLLLYVIVLKVFISVCPVIIRNKIYIGCNYFLLCSTLFMFVMLLYFSLEEGINAFYQDGLGEIKIAFLLILLLLSIPVFMETIANLQKRNMTSQSKTSASAIEDHSKDQEIQKR